MHQTALEKTQLNPISQSVGGDRIWCTSSLTLAAHSREMWSQMMKCAFQQTPQKRMEEKSHQFRDKDQDLLSYSPHLPLWLWIVNRLLTPHKAIEPLPHHFPQNISTNQMSRQHCRHWGPQTWYQSIKSIKFLLRQYPRPPSKPGSVAQQQNRCSNAKSMKQFRSITWPLGCASVVREKGQVKEMHVLRGFFFFKVAAEMAERTKIYSGMLFQRDGPKDWKALAPVMVLNLGTDRPIPLLFLREWDGSDKASININININWMFSTKYFVGQQTDLEQYSNLYMHPTKGTKQWNTASKRRWLCHNTAQSILHTLKFGEVSVCDIIPKWFVIIKTIRHRSTCN